MALVTFLFQTHSKAKAKLTEVQTVLQTQLAKKIIVECDWKFIEREPCKALPQDVQKQIVLDTVPHNVQQVLSGADSLIAACTTSPTVKEFVSGTVTKVLFKYDATDGVKATTGVSFVDLRVAASTLEVVINAGSVKSLCSGDWGIIAKLEALTGSSSTPNAAPVAAPAPAPTVPPTVSVAPSTAPSVSDAVAPTSTNNSTVVEVARRKKIGGAPGGNGASTFLYLTLDKAKKRVLDIAKLFHAAIGRTDVAVEVDWAFLKDAEFTKESEADQKGIVSGPVLDNLQSALCGPVNDGQTLTSVFANPSFASERGKLKKVKWSYGNDAVPTSGWKFISLTWGASGSEVILKSPIANIEEPYATTVWSPPPVSAPLVATASASVAPESKSAPAPAPAPTPTAATVVSPAPAVTSTPATIPSSPSGKRVKIGGKPGGYGAATFLYLALDKAKKRITEIAKQFNAAVGKNVVFDVDWSFLKSTEFVAESEADQKAIVSGPVLDNLNNLLLSPTGSDTLSKLYTHPEYKTRCESLAKIRLLYVKDIVSQEGWKSLEFIWDDPGTEFQIRINIQDIDEYYDPSTWLVSNKAKEAILGVEKRKEAEAAAVAERARLAELASQNKLAYEETLRRQAEEKRIAAKLAEEEQVRAQLLATAGERQKILAEAGVLDRLAKLEQSLAQETGGKVIRLVVDDLFIHDKKLRWKEVNYQKTLLKNICMEDYSLFAVLVRACKQILETAVGKVKLPELVDEFVLKFEALGTEKIPSLLYDSSSRRFIIVATFTVLYDPKTWITTVVESAKGGLFRTPTIPEFFKGVIANSCGFLELMARDEAVTDINARALKYWPQYFANRSPPELVFDWETLDAQNASSPVIVRMFKHYQIPAQVMQPLLDSFKNTNAVVLAILHKTLKEIQIAPSSTFDYLSFDTSGTMRFTYDWAKQQRDAKQFCLAIEKNVRENCVGLTVKNVSAEIAMAEAQPAIDSLNLTLTRATDIPAGFVLDYPSFVDTPEFAKLYGDAKFSIIHTEAVESLYSIFESLKSIAATALGMPYVRGIKKILVTFDVTDLMHCGNPKVDWNAQTGSLTLTFNKNTYGQKVTRDFTPGLEFTFGILVESSYKETKGQVENFISTAQTDFGVKLPIELDQSYLKSPPFLATPPSKMKDTVINALTTIPVTCFLGPMGLAHCSEFPKARKILHDKVKVIRLIPDGSLKPKSWNLELSGNGELVLRTGFECEEIPRCGYQLATDILKIRPLIEQEVIDESNAKLAAYSQQLQSNSKLNIEMDWQALLADKEFVGNHDYVNKYIRQIPVCIGYSLNGIAPHWDQGLLTCLANRSHLKTALSNYKKLVYHVDTLSKIKVPAGLFTPLGYEIRLDGSTIHIHFNLKEYLAGCGTNIEWHLCPKEAQKYQNQYIQTIAKRNRIEEEQRRVDEVRWAHERNQREQADYASKVEKYNSDMKYYQERQKEKCSSCNGSGQSISQNGYAEKCFSCGGTGTRNHNDYMPTMPTPPVAHSIPVFSPIDSFDFTKGLDRSELREKHYQDWY